MPEAIDSRFDSKWTPEPNTGCYIWVGALQSDGYGSFWVGEKTTKAHRFAFERAGGVLVDGMVLDHACRVRNCVNPAHLRQVTQRENVHAPGSEAVAAKHAARTHCPQGHEYSPENTKIHLGMRRCRECHRRDGRERYARKEVQP